MDTREDLAWYAMERTFGPIPKERDQWSKIQDEHYPECPVSIAAEGKRISTCCLCSKIEIAEDCIMDDGSDPEPIDHREDR